MPPQSRTVTEEQFESLFMALARDVVDAHIFWGQARALAAQLEQWPEVYTEGEAFWIYALQAHRCTALSCLGRVFDQEPSALHLRSLLLLTRDHPQYFGKEAAARRQPDDPFAQWLPDDAVPPSHDQVTSDLAQCEMSDPDVKALSIYRHKVVAHRDTKISMKASSCDLPSLQDEQIERLLHRAKTLLNRYSYKRDASCFGMTPLGHDAVEKVFKRVQRDLDHDRQELDIQMKPYI